MIKIQILYDMGFWSTSLILTLRVNKQNGNDELKTACHLTECSDYKALLCLLFVITLAGILILFHLAFSIDFYLSPAF